jgi:serine/threonine protein kinase
VYITVIYVISLLLERVTGASDGAKNARGVGFCLYTAGHLILFSIMEPLWVFITLQRDSEYWRGHTGGGDAGKRTGRGSGGNLNVALVGRVSLNEGAASALADTMDQFGRDHTYVELLNFAFLTINTRKVVGAGGTAKVYEGQFKGETVAIKLVYPPELTQEEVRGFLREASALEEAGEHENIIKVLGVCVMPPSIALVLEMCEQGDLNSHVRQQHEEGSLDHRQQLELALDCAKGVEFLHNGDDDNPRINGPIVHNDLKSFNVLVRVNDRTEKPFIAKLADLEFAQEDGAGGGGGGGGGGGDGAQFVRTESSMMRPPPVPDTVNWTAPELMRAGAEGWPTVASDAWALGMLLYEIFALEIPFAEGQCITDLKQVLERQTAAAAAAAAGEGAEADAEAGTAGATAAAAAAAAPFYGREYLIARICDATNPLRPPLSDDPTARPSLVPQDVSTLLSACWANEPDQRLSPKSMRDSLQHLLRQAPQRLSGLETLRGVGLPKVPALQPRYRSKQAEDGGASAAMAASIPPPAGGEDGEEAADGETGAVAELPGGEQLTDFEARGKYGVGTLGAAGSGSGSARRPRLHSERGVGLPSPRSLSKTNSGAPPQDPTGFGDGV